MRASIGRTAGYAADIPAGATLIATAGTFKEGYVVAFLLWLTGKKQPHSAPVNITSCGSE